MSPRDDGVEELETERIPHGVQPGPAGGPSGPAADRAPGGPAAPSGEAMGGPILAAGPERRVRNRGRALAIAVAADLVQFLLLPSVVGEMSPLNQVLDLGVMALLIRLIGFHWALLPTFLVEMVPFADAVPLWTLAVLIATRGAKQPRA